MYICNLYAHIYIHCCFEGFKLAHKLFHSKIIFWEIYHITHIVLIHFNLKREVGSYTAGKRVNLYRYLVEQLEIWSEFERMYIL